MHKGKTASKRQRGSTLGTNGWIAYGRDAFFPEPSKEPACTRRWTMRLPRRSIVGIDINIFMLQVRTSRFIIEP